MSKSAKIVELNPDRIMLEDLLRSDITAKVAKQLGMVPCSSETTKRETMIPEDPNSGFAGQTYKIPYFDLDGKPVEFARYRLVRPSNDGHKYHQKAGTLPQLYLPPLFKLTWREIFEDPTKELWIVEGEKKAIRGCLAGKYCIGIGGVWNFMYTVNKSAKVRYEGFQRIFEDSKNKRHYPIEELTWPKWRGRHGVVCFDSDYTRIDRASLILARETLCSILLFNFHAERIRVCNLPNLEDGSKQGLDDYLVTARKLDTDHSYSAGIEKLESLCEDVNENFRQIYEMNKRYVILPNGDIYDDLTNTLVKPTPFINTVTRNIVVSQLIDGKYKRVSAGELWLENPDRPTANGLTYQPNEDRFIGGLFNRWQDTRPPAVKGDVTPFFDLLDWHNITGDERESLIRWAAWPLQHPRDPKVLWVILMLGVPGSGKTLLGYIIASCYGVPGKSANVSVIQNVKELYSDFNTLLTNCQFIVADEVMSGDKRQDNDHLKTLITGNIINVHNKFQDRRAGDNFANIFLSSNHGNAIRLDSLSERRYLVLQSSDQKLQECRHYNKILNWYGNGTGPGPSHLRYYLEHLRLGDFDPRKAPPVTAAMTQMFQSTHSRLELELSELREDPSRLMVLRRPRRLWSMTELLSALGLLINDPQLSPSQFHQANNRETVFLKLPAFKIGKLGAGRRTVNAYCHINYFPDLFRLRQTELGKIWEKEHQPVNEEPEF